MKACDLESIRAVPMIPAKNRTVVELSKLQRRSVQ